MVLATSGPATVDGEEVAGDTALAVALHGAPAVWVSAADNAWRDVRDVRRAVPKGVPWWLDAMGPLGQPRGDLADGCEAGRLTSSGTGRVYALHLWAGPRGVVATPTVRFRPMVDLGKGTVGVEGLPVACWAPNDCTAVPDGPLRSACDDGRTGAPGFPDQLMLAPAEGRCLEGWSPASREAWRADFADILVRMGPRSQDESILLPAPDVPIATVLDALSGFVRAGRGLPILPGIDVQGGQPMQPGCPDAISAEPMLALAEAFWLGQRIAEAQPSAPEGG